MIPVQRLTANIREDYPGQEANRLAVLRGLGLLDTPPSESFDRVTRLAARTLGVPIVLVSLVDETRQWFKSRIGVDIAQTPREASICAHAVMSRSPLVISDTLLDPRFAENPLVTGAPYIRAYAGVPLFTRLGHAIGTLCAIDAQPREFTHGEVASLTDYARILQDAIHTQEIAAQSDQVLQLANERERLFHDTFEFSAVGMVHLTLTGQLIRCNRALSEMLQYAPQELCQASVIDLTHPEDLARSALNFRRIVAGDVARYGIEKRLQRSDKSYLWCHLSVSSVLSARGEPAYLIAIVQDINERIQLEHAANRSRQALEEEVAAQTRMLHESNDALRAHVKHLLDSELAVRQSAGRLRAIANNVPAMIGYWNRDLVCEFANEAYRAWFGIAPDEVVGRQMADLLGLKIFASAEPRARLALQGESQRFEQQALMQDGTEAQLDVRYIPDVEENRSVRGFFVLVTDATASHRVQEALEAANAKLTNDSSSDYLTGLANRDFFRRRTDEAVQRFGSHGETFGLILFDLDNFNSINERCGHDAGDGILRAVGELLKGHLRSHRDVAARLAGGEFGMLCFGALDEELLGLLAERIRSEMENRAVDEDTGGLQLTASFGVALGDAADSDWRAIHSRAHAALFQAKAAGKNRVVFGAVQAL